MKNKFKPVHIIHLLLYAPVADSNLPIKISGRTRLMKMVFLFEQELAKYFEGKLDIKSFEFEAYNFGPYSKKVYEAIDFLYSREIIDITSDPSALVDENDMSIDRALVVSEEDFNSFPNNSGIIPPEEFLLKPSGIKMMEDPDKWFAWANLTKEEQNILIKFKTKMVNTSLRNILQYVYTKYPKYAEKSIIYKTLFPAAIK